jgi:uncharacterized damage-inducible protein DinB
MIIELNELFAYKIWSDKIYFDYCLGLTEKQLLKKFEGYSKSFRDILEHIREVTWFWFEFITTKQLDNPLNFESMTTPDLLSYLTKQNEKIQKFIVTKDLTKELTIHWQETDNPVETTVENILFNLVTHNAYHHCQLALFLRLLGFETIIETDFNPYFAKWDKTSRSFLSSYFLLLKLLD